MLEKKWQKTLLTVVLTLAALLYIYPIVMIYYNSFKSYGEIMIDAISLPSVWTVENFKNAWKIMNFLTVLKNTFLITLFSVSGIVIISSMAAYKLARVQKTYSRLLKALFLMPMLVPIQSIMITFLQVMTKLELTNTHQGLVVAYWGMGCSTAVFLYYGFVKSFPVEIEEAARIDGSNSWHLFAKIVFPLLKPVTGTVVILDVMWIWNDFLLPLLLINRSRDLKTLQLASYSFFGQYVTKWNYALAGIVMAVTPTVLFFIFMQKYIVKGIAAGAVKG